MRYIFVLLSLVSILQCWPIFDNSATGDEKKSDKVIDETKQKTNLHISIEENKSIFEIIDIIKKGADVNSVDKFGDTPLHYAARSGNLTIIEYLVQNGAKINNKNFIGLTPIDYAIENAQLEAFDLLQKLLIDQRWINE
jgi:ankyrin repeat protein